MQTKHWVAQLSTVKHNDAGDLNASDNDAGAGDPRRVEIYEFMDVNFKSHVSRGCSEADAIRLLAKEINAKIKEDAESSEMAPCDTIADEFAICVEQTLHQNVCEIKEITESEELPEPLDFYITAFLSALVTVGRRPYLQCINEKHLFASHAEDLLLVVQHELDSMHASAPSADTHLVDLLRIGMLGDPQADSTSDHVLAHCSAILAAASTHDSS